ncbi:hypothetical protein HC928_18670, partial [bacterium]|nr:hypothetical protein [bacterium]
VIVMDGAPVHNYPHYDFNPEAIYSQIVYAGKASDVTHTLCNGAWLLKDRQLMTIDVESVKTEAAELC